MSASNNSRNLYRDPQKGKIAGVCAGLADYFGVETWIVRLLAITGLIFAGFITFTAYIAAWFKLGNARAPARVRAATGAPR